MNMKRATLALAVLAATTMFAVSIRAQEAKKGETKAAPRDGIRSGYRGFSLTLQGSQMAFVNKGDRVDVLVTFEAETKEVKKEKVTATILQNVVVVGLRAPAKLDENGVVELEVNPNEGQYAALAVQQGAVQLLVRSEGDAHMEPMEMASFRKLFR
jgi:Flp pilus assembly protein CpaB